MYIIYICQIPMLCLCTFRMEALALLEEADSRPMEFLVTATTIYYPKPGDSMMLVVCHNSLPSP